MKKREKREAYSQAMQQLWIHILSRQFFFSRSLMLLQPPQSPSRSFREFPSIGLGIQISNSFSCNKAQVSRNLEIK